MKHISNQAEKDALAAVRSESAQVLLRHVLSPIEKAGFRRSFQPFRYNLNGVKIYISGANSRRLLHFLNTKISFINAVVDKERQSIDIPLHLREVFDDPRQILSLPAPARNRLCAIECYTMFTAMQLGRSFFLNWPGFGRRSMAALDALFASHNATHLFK